MQGNVHGHPVPGDTALQEGAHETDHLISVPDGHLHPSLCQHSRSPQAYETQAPVHQRGSREATLRRSKDLQHQLHQPEAAGNTYTPLLGWMKRLHLDHQSTEHCIHQPAEHPHQHLIHQPAEHRHQHLIHQPAEHPHQHFIHQPVEHPHQHLNHPPAEHPHQRVNQTTNPTPTAAAHQLAEQLHHKTTRDKPTTLKERRLG